MFFVLFCFAFCCFLGLFFFSFCMSLLQTLTNAIPFSELKNNNNDMPSFISAKGFLFSFSAAEAV